MTGKCDVLRIALNKQAKKVMHFFGSSFRILGVIKSKPDFVPSLLNFIHDGLVRGHMVEVSNNDPITLIFFSSEGMSDQTFFPY